MFPFRPLPSFGQLSMAGCGKRGGIRNLYHLAARHDLTRLSFSYPESFHQSGIGPANGAPLYAAIEGCQTTPSAKSNAREIGVGDLSGSGQYSEVEKGVVAQADISRPEAVGGREGCFQLTKGRTRHCRSQSQIRIVHVGDDSNESIFRDGCSRPSPDCRAGTEPRHYCGVMLVSRI